MKKKKTYGMNIGASSLLIIIVILCLVCFAGLSQSVPLLITDSVKSSLPVPPPTTKQSARRTWKWHA